MGKEAGDPLPGDEETGGATARRRRCLLVVHTNTYFANLLPTARLLKQSAAYEPVFLFASQYPTLDRDQTICRSEGIRLLGPSVEQQCVEQGGWERLGRRIARVLAARGWKTPLSELHSLLDTKARVGRLIADEGIALLIFPSDNRYDIAAYIAAGHEAGVPSVVVPSFMAATREWAEAMANNPDYQTRRWSNRVAAKLYPRWVHEHGGTRLIALPSEQLLAREWLGLAPPRPWTLHSGFADAIALESPAVRDYCLREGLPEGQLVVTGSVDHDLMVEALGERSRRRAELCERLGLPAERRMLLTALPPDQLYGRGRKDCDFRTYAELVEFWMDSVARPSGFNVIVSLHPSVKREDWGHIEQGRAKIADDKISTLMPLCDLFVASISATIQWAIACGRPVLNYDVYRYRYPDYVGLEGVIATEEQGEFVAAIDRLASDANFFEELAAHQARNAPAWGTLDGRAGSRLMALFDRLTGPPRVSLDRTRVDSLLSGVCRVEDGGGSA
jgi:hypothetical protein